MFYNEEQAIKACQDDPSSIFLLMKEGHIALVDKILTKKLVSVNTTDELGNDVLVRLLKGKHYECVLKHMKNKDWDVNHQNQDGETFAHVLVSIHYVSVVDIIKQLKKKKDFLPNIKNNKGETILDKSINDHYIYTTVKILEDQRFTNIDIVSFKNLYDTYIKSANYGKYSRLTNLDIILDSLKEKSLGGKMDQLVHDIERNYNTIKEEIFENRFFHMEGMINSLLKEGNA